ncbi:MAG: hypothetical protein ACTHMR_21695 [Thermomicrobiales bacterium]
MSQPLIAVRKDDTTLSVYELLAGEGYSGLIGNESARGYSLTKTE